MKKQVRCNRFDHVEGVKVHQVETCVDGKKWVVVHKDTLMPNCWVIVLAFQSVGYQVVECD